MRNPNRGSPLHNMLDNSELKMINIVKFNVVVQDQTPNFTDITVRSSHQHQSSEGKVVLSTCKCVWDVIV